LANHIVYAFISGLGFFIGGAAMAAGTGMALLVRGSIGRTAARALVVAGLGMVWLSATPMPLWTFAAMVVLAGVWLVTEAGRDRFGPRPLRVATFALSALLAGSVIAELPHHLRPDMPAPGTRTIYVIGDSISGGIGIKREVLWPQALQGLMPGHRVVNLALAGATCAEALSQARHVPEQDAYVLLEIGGNDMLGHSGPVAFRRDLEALLQELSQGDRTLVMFELPLPPFYAGYGRVQRELAARYSVTLIPKRYFARIIMTRGDTLDGLHLSSSGHQHMAQMVYDLLTRR
jgi:acyl-CoA thioesterase-1